MRDFLEFLRQKKFSVPVFGMLLALGTFGGFLLKNRLSWFDLSPETLEFWRGSSKPVLFVPSPLETYLLDSREDLWPDTFHPRNVVSVSRIPEFYTRVARMERWDVISPLELETARQWSVLANSQHLSSLQEKLRKPTSKAIRAEKECSPLMQETLYRISQVWPEFLTDVRVYFNTCAPGGVHLLWWELQQALRTQDPEALRTVGEKFQMQMNDFPGQWSRWFALEAYQLAHVLSAQIQESKNE